MTTRKRRHVLSVWVDVNDAIDDWPTRVEFVRGDKRRWYTPGNASWERVVCALTQMRVQAYTMDCGCERWIARQERQERVDAGQLPLPLGGGA